MLTQRKKLILVALSIVIVLCIVFGIGLIYLLGNHPKKLAVISQDDYSFTIEYAQYRVQRAMKQYDLPSVAIALVDDQNVIWQETYGLANIEEEIFAAPDTVYKMYSVAKAFTAIEIMRLVEEGLVDLDAPITEYLPDFSIQSRFPENDPITVRAILAHHAGLPRNGCAHVTWYGGGDIMDELAASLANCQMVYPVGERYKYTNIGSNVLAAIIQNVRGKPFPYHMEEDLLAPIGMANSAFLISDLPAGHDLALGYEYYEGDYYPIEQGDNVMLASGNLYSTLTDMAAFAQFILRTGEAGGMQIIRPATLNQMYADQYSRPEDPQPMGLGWKTAQVFGTERLVWHDGGASEGVGSLVALLPERKLGVVLFANGSSFEGSVSVFLALDILAQMMEAKYGIIPSQTLPPEPIETDPNLLAEYTGKYIVWGQALDVSLKGEQLQLDFQGIKLNLVPTSPTKFRVDHWLLRLPLEKFLLLPFETGALREMEVEFQVGDSAVMMLNFSGVSYEICPKYPENAAIPPLWKELAGEYDLLYRLPTGSRGGEVFGHDSIQIEDGVLTMPGVIGPILPISESEIVILSGSFAGETMVYNPDTGTIYHQWVVYKR